MRVWLYARLSRDEDEELNSLTNQRKIVYEYAVAKEYEIIGESFDDNISGMHFNRPGIDKIYDAVEAGAVDAILVKDLSRIGRHRTQTALFIDYLREHHVRVLSVTENIDTSDENDDLIVGFKGLVNDFYARDIGRKITSGYRQKQKSGIVIVAPFGYFKDRNTNKVTIVEEAAETVKLIFSLYVGGNGLKAIARKLNELGAKTPAKMQLEVMGKSIPNTCPEISRKYIWINTTVKNILINEIYTGTLVNHKSETSSINKTFRFTQPGEQYRHENYVPAIITRELWEQAQLLLSERNERAVRAGHNQRIHRYSGLILCQQCGRKFVAIKRTWQGKERVEYACNSNHRYGAEYCTPHRVSEELLDRLIIEELKSLKKSAEENWNAIAKSVQNWASKQSNVDVQIKRLQERLARLEEDVEGILLERIRDKGNAARYDRMLEKHEKEILLVKEQIAGCRNMEIVLNKKRLEMKTSIDLIDDILDSRNLNEANLRMLLQEIRVNENSNGKLDIEFCMRAAFRTHCDWYNEVMEVIDSAAELIVGSIDDETA